MNLHTITKIPVHKSHSRRFIELDVLRGFAIIFMIFLHILWNLDYFGILPLNKNIYQFNVICPTLFFLLLGICLTVGYNRTDSNSNSKMYKHLLFRGLWVFGLGMVITVITLFFMPDRPIIFGVLHCIGFSIILSVPFLKFKAYNILFAALIIMIGLIIGSIQFENPTAAHLVIGLHQADVWRYTVDYFPIFPWFGVSLLGVALGNLLYKGNERRFRFPDLPNLSKFKPVTMFSWFGQHSLAIYLLHQPIIAGTLSIFVIL